MPQSPDQHAAHPDPKTTQELTREVLGMVRTLEMDTRTIANIQALQVRLTCCPPEVTRRVLADLMARGLIEAATFQITDAGFKALTQPGSES